MGLTPKQEKFCIEYVKTGNKSEAYRLAYNAADMKPEVINKEACLMFNNRNITERIEELQNNIEAKELYTLEESIKADLRLIKRYEDALAILESNESKDRDIEVAQRTIKYISANGYSSAQDRLAKKQGWFEKDNAQKTRTMSDEEKDRRINYLLDKINAK